MSTTQIDNRFRPYPTYKPSGIEWLGDIPGHWQVKRTDAVLHAKRENVSSNALADVAVFHYSIPSLEETGDGIVQTMAEIESNKILLAGGELLVSRLNPRKSRILIAEKHDMPTLCSGEFVVMEPAGCDASYALYSYSSETVRQHLSANVQSATRSHQRVKPDFISKLWWAFPPPTEQRAIASFLDRETARIDGLIAKKERLIELLHEKRTALISQAVIKGLDPTVPMKDSGVEWLGEIPQHWEVRRLKYVVRDGLVNGVFKKQDQFGSGVRLINVFDIYRDDFFIDLDSLERVEVEQEEIQRYKVEDGDIFFVRSSLKLEGVATSACAIGVTEPIVFECHIIRARPDVAKAIPKFLISFLNSKLARQRLIALSETVTMTTIDQNNLQSIEVLVPSPDEQSAIVGFLARETSRIQRLIGKVREGIERLKEHRTALISAAVTGKIDVRETPMKTA